MRSRWDILKHYTLEIGIYLCAFLFVYAAVSKLLDFETFETQLGQSPLLSAYAKPVAIGVPLLELLISIFLMVPRFRFWGLYAFYGLMVMFTTYIVIILNFTDFVPCSCGGVLEAMGWTEHLMFNGVFILLSGYLIWFLFNNGLKSLWILGLLTVFSVSAVSVVFLSSEKQMKRNNAFIRRYVPHPIEKIGEYDLGVNSYYIAGIDDEGIYMGNTTAPLSLSVLDTSLKFMKKIRVSIDQMELPYRHVRLLVKPPFFYVSDGNVPIILKGETKGWKAKTLLKDAAYFSQWAVTDTTSFVIRTINSQTKEHMLGVLKVDKEETFYYQENFLEKQLDGIFDTDGLLLWNDSLGKLIYVYYYRNQYKVSDANFKNSFTGKTIDTISVAQLGFVYNSSKDQIKIDRESIKINNYSTTADDFLFVHSKRIGRHESIEMLKKASVIDVYDLMNNTYKFSFYLFHHKGKKMKSFEIHRGLLVVVMDDVLITYRLNPQYFDSTKNK